MGAARPVRRLLAGLPGGGRGLGIEAVRAINEFAHRRPRPDRTLLLVLDPRTGRERSRSRDGPPDRLEREQDDFFERIAAAYSSSPPRIRDRIRKLDAEQPPDAVLAAALAELSDLV